LKAVFGTRLGTASKLVYLQFYLSFRNRSAFSQKQLPSLLKRINKFLVRETEKRQILFSGIAVRRSSSDPAEANYLWNGGNVPFGYSATNKKLVPDPLEAPRLQFMFQRFAEEPSLSGLRSELHRHGWYARSGKPWSKMALDHILRNPVYCGMIRFNERQYQGEHEALIEEGLYRQVQSVRRDRSHGTTKIKREFLLKGLVRCAECGSVMTPHYTQKWQKDGSLTRIYYYRCTRTMHLSNAVCSVKHINADHLENLVIGKLSELSQNEAYLKMSVEEINGDLQRKAEPLAKQTQQIRERLAEIESETRRYVKALGQGRLSIERLESEIAALEADRDVCKSSWTNSKEN
jgi:Recombinase zinc beta ribbon domain/Recombinase